MDRGSIKLYLSILFYFNIYNTTECHCYPLIYSSVVETFEPVVPIVPRNRTRIVAPTFSNSISWRSTLLFVRGFYYSTAMRSGNDQFPHDGISIVASSVTRFDTPKINSPTMRSERGREKKKEVTGLAVFSSRRSLIAQSWISASSLIRTTNARESPYGAMRGSRGANFPRVIAPLHRSNSATFKETARAALAELISSGCDRVQKSICHLVRQGPETRSFASERRRVFFYGKVARPSLRRISTFLFRNGF